jgi:hypothetical protein
MLPSQEGINLLHGISHSCIPVAARPMTDTITVSWNPPRNQNIMVRGYTIGWGKGIPDVYTQLLDGKQRFYVIEGVGECTFLTPSVVYRLLLNVESISLCTVN